MFRRVRYWLRAVFRSGQLEAEMQEEMRQHLERSNARHLARGVSETEAWYAARREFGILGPLQEEAREARGARWTQALWRDTKSSWRAFGRNPAFTAVVVASIALVLAIIGLYGVMACSVASVRVELGIRAALGAGRWRLMRLVVGGAGTMVGAGLAIGGCGAIVGTRLLRRFLFGVEPADPRILMLAALRLVVAALGAAWLPAKRAAGMDPALVLRED